ncbi:hypothetical protein b3_0061 [Synechococcus phage B3]|nr:hypothetical protein b3_0061 [Synechococcus phage B3]QGT54681.1 hypothetical protein b23_0061 [Synechococcus phage B23]
MNIEEKKQQLNKILIKGNIEYDRFLVESILELIEECEKDSYEDGKWDEGRSLYLS